MRNHRPTHDINQRLEEIPMADDKVMVNFQPSGRSGPVPKGINLIEASRLLGADIEALCGEKKVCGKCAVRIEEGHFEKYNITSGMSHVSKWQQDEESKFINDKLKAQGYRLACVTKLQGDVLVFVPEESRAGKQVVSKAARDIHNRRCYHQKRGFRQNAKVQQVPQEPGHQSAGIRSCVG